MIDTPEKLAEHILGKEEYRNAPCQAHPYELIANKFATQQARIEALEAEVERRKEAFENQWHLHYEMQRNAWGRVQELESAARGLLSAIEAYQYAQAPAEPLPWLAPQANALAALLESEPTAHTCNASCQLPACVLRRRVEGAVVTPPILRIEK